MPGTELRAWFNSCNHLNLLLKLRPHFTHQEPSTEESKDLSEVTLLTGAETEFTLWNSGTLALQAKLLTTTFSMAIFKKVYLCIFVAWVVNPDDSICEDFTRRRNFKMRTSRRACWACAQQEKQNACLSLLPCQGIFCPPAHSSFPSRASPSSSVTKCGTLSPQNS